MTGEIEVRLLENIESFTRNQTAWSKVVSRSDYRLHSSACFISSWWASFGRQDSVVCVLMFSERKPIAAIPLLFSEKTIGYIRFPYCRLLGNNFSPRTDVTILSHHEEVFDELMKILRDRGARWFDVGWVPSGTARQSLASLVARGWGGLQLKSLDLPLVEFQSDWAEWMRAKSRTFRKSIRAAASRCKEFSCVNFSGESVDVDCLIASMEYVNRHSWSYETGSAFVGVSEEREFVRALVERFASQGSIIASVIRDKDGNAAAFAMGISVSGRVYGFKTGYRKDLKNTSLGTHVMAHFMELCASSGADSVDMDVITTHGDYKRRWCNRTEHTECWRVFDSRPLSRVAKAGYTAREFFRNRLRRPRLIS